MTPPLPFQPVHHFTLPQTRRNPAYGILLPSQMNERETLMTSTRASVLAALVAAIGLTAMSPAFAAGPDHQRKGENDRMMDFRRDAPGGAFQFATFTCGPKAADRIDNRLDRMSDRLDLTADQEKLFETFRTSALTAQTKFADLCDTIRPDRPDRTARATRAERPDLVQRMEQGLKIDQARVAAMSELLPQFKSFYESLTDKQKAELMPPRMQGMEMPGKGMKGMDLKGAPGHPGQPPVDAPDNGLDG